MTENEYNYTDEEYWTMSLYDMTSEQAAFITGANYVIDGGRSCGGMG